MKPPARVIHTSQLIALTLGYFINFQSEVEIRAPVSKLQSYRAVGVCNIPGELLKAGGDTVLRKLAAVFNNIWKTCEIPPD